MTQTTHNHARNWGDAKLLLQEQEMLVQSLRQTRAELDRRIDSALAALGRAEHIEMKARQELERDMWAQPSKVAEAASQVANAAPPETTPPDTYQCTAVDVGIEPGRT